jgi:hypothetical protein
MTDIVYGGGTTLSSPFVWLLFECKTANPRGDPLFHRGYNSLRLHLKRSEKGLTITGFGLAGILLLVAVFLFSYLLSFPHSLDEKAAAQLIRHYLRYQSSQRHAEFYKRGVSDTEASRRYQEELNKIDQLQFKSVKVGRLFPDYFLSEWGPTFYAKAVIRDADNQVRTRYFNLGTGDLVIGESSEFVWFFVF